MNSLDKEIDKAEKDVLTITAYDKSLSNILRLKSKKFSIEEMKNIVLKELETIRINPIYDEQRQKLIELFLDSNKHLITNKIKLNTTLNSAMRELSKVYNPDDKLFKFTLNSTKYFINSLVESFLSLEINYLIHLKDNLKAYGHFQKKSIVGKLLNFDLINEMFEVNEIELNRLLDTLGTIVRSYTILLQMNNSEWFDLYWDNRREHQEEKIYYKKERISRKNKDKKAKNRVGRPGKFSSLIEFQKKLESLPNWKSLSKTELAKKLGYKSSSGLNELLKTNEWSLPK